MQEAIATKGKDNETDHSHQPQFPRSQTALQRQLGPNRSEERWRLCRGRVERGPARSGGYRRWRLSRPVGSGTAERLTSLSLRGPRVWVPSEKMSLGMGDETMFEWLFEGVYTPSYWSMRLKVLKV
ncbi:hypothetical protein LOK49_LG10G02973 [Camellia lanceoleosa]|uniref:Uncharacterized protein n=1 Tax=Camellia lanceoleosa TaxID=1840588 RepID=A0ACC0G9A4_9ERIC|nr:hypothetical protein LOK49_LG10G02973 [Camellia lanceoleosa]